MTNARADRDVAARIDRILAQPFSIELANELYEGARIFDDNSNSMHNWHEMAAIVDRDRDHRGVFDLVAHTNTLARRRPRDALVCALLQRAGVPRYMLGDIVERFRMADCSMDATRVNNVRVPFDQSQRARITRYCFDLARNFRVTDSEHTLTRVAMCDNDIEFASFTYVPAEGHWVLEHWFQPPKCPPLPLRHLSYNSIMISATGIVTELNVVLYDGVHLQHSEAYHWLFGPRSHTAGLYNYQVAFPRPWAVKTGYFHLLVE